MGCYKCGSEEGSDVKLCPACRDKRLAAREAIANAPAAGDQPVGETPPPEIPIPIPVPVPEGQVGVLWLVISGVVGIIVVILLGITVMRVLGGGTTEKPPELAAIEEPTRNFLLLKLSCGGQGRVDRFSLTKVGDYDSSMGGFPLYGTFSIACQDGGGGVPWTNDSDPNQPIAYVHKNDSGGYEVTGP